MENYQNLNYFKVHLQSTWEANFSVHPIETTETQINFWKNLYICNNNALQSQTTMTKKRTESRIEQHHTLLTPTWGVALPPLCFSISPYDSWSQLLPPCLTVIGCQSLLYIFFLSFIVCYIYGCRKKLWVFYFYFFTFICRSRIFVSKIGG